MVLEGGSEGGSECGSGEGMQEGPESTQGPPLGTQGQLPRGGEREGGPVLRAAASLTTAEACLIAFSWNEGR